MQLGVGYVVAAVAPVALGLLRDTTGSFSAGLWLVAATAGLVVCAVAAALRLLPESAPSRAAALGTESVRSCGTEPE
jgi:ACS family 4-hydroxyphenylacetate permease-like MFS transporter